MVADLVNQDVADDMAEAFVVLGPVIQDRPAVEPDHVGQSRHVAKTLLGQADALEQAEQVELALAFHLVEGLLGGEVVDADDQALAEPAKLRRQPLKNVVRRHFHLGQRGRFQVRPHGLVLARVSQRCIRLYKDARLTGAAKTGSVVPKARMVRVGNKMRAKTALTLLCMGLFSQLGVNAQAQTSGNVVHMAQAVSPDDDVPPPRTRQRRLRVTPYYAPDGVYPRYNPGPDAVRECNVAYVQEHRPSGTVITPHMSCYWRRG